MRKHDAVPHRLRVPLRYSKFQPFIDPRLASTHRLYIAAETDERRGHDGCSSCLQAGRKRPLVALAVSALGGVIGQSSCSPATAPAVSRVSCRPVRNPSPPPCQEYYCSSEGAWELRTTPGCKKEPQKEYTPATRLFQTKEDDLPWLGTKLRVPIYTSRTQSFDCTAQGGGHATTITLRGWLAFQSADSNGEGEAHYIFEPDIPWAQSQGIEVERLVRVGNQDGEFGPCGSYKLYPSCYTDGSWRAMAGVARINVEANGWFVSRRGGDEKQRVCRLYAPPAGAHPAQWIQSADNPDLFYPFAPNRPDPLHAELEIGKYYYVEITGSLVADTPHVDGERDTPIGEWKDFWCNGWRSTTSHCSDSAQARWIELHPVDSIKVLDERTRTELAYLIAVGGGHDKVSWTARLPAPRSTGGPTRAQLIQLIPIIRTDSDVRWSSSTEQPDAVTLTFTVPGPNLPLSFSGSRIAAIARVGRTACPPFNACGSSCVNMNTNQANCGACGNACNGTDRCTNGKCVGVGCRAGEKWCECVDRCLSPGACRAACKL
ncbi:MAG: hypothetical protein E6J90_52620 [Deltaproteobacteria bacterium]|nr:MAG: hypothetical protein E6J90_52620 [Deltaproteobacteria bacterium]